MSSCWKREWGGFHIFFGKNIALQPSNDCGQAGPREDYIIPPQVIMKWTGHSDYKSMKPYIDIATKTKSDAMQKIADMGRRMIPTFSGKFLPHSSVFFSNKLPKKFSTFLGFY